MEMKKQKKIIGGMILVLAVTACASFFKSAAEEIAQEETSEIYQNEIKTIYTEAYQDEVETQIEEEKSSGRATAGDGRRTGGRQNRCMDHGSLSQSGNI